VKEEITGCTSTLTWDEVFYILLRSIGANEAVEAGRFLLSFPTLTFLNVDFGLILEASKITRKYKIMPRDAIHAASAIKYCNGKIISNDSGFDSIKEITRKF
jgi:predicted nucleic acid-binding protein